MGFTGGGYNPRLQVSQNRTGFKATGFTSDVSRPLDANWTHARWAPKNQLHQGSLNYQFWENQTRQIYGNFEGFPL